jgi:hypothetical protein
MSQLPFLERFEVAQHACIILRGRSYREAKNLRAAFWVIAANMPWRRGMEWSRAKKTFQQAGRASQDDLAF